MCILMGKCLAVILNRFLLLQVFWVENAKIDFFKEKMVLRVVFYKIDVKMFTNWLNALNFI